MNAHDSLVRHLKEIGTLKSVSAVLNWDERTQLPPKGGESRADQIALLATLVHGRLTDQRVGEWLAACEEELGRTGERAKGRAGDDVSDVAVNVRETRRNYDRATKLPAEWVEEMAKTEVLGQQAWVEARKRSDFKMFQPWLEKILGLKKRQAEYLRTGDGANGRSGDWQYDALLDEFEPRETTANLTRVFESLRGPLVELVGKIRESGKVAPVEILERKYPADAQHRLALEAAKAVGFDFEGGRLDVSVHPFSTGIAPGDTRITTRYDENYFGDAFFGTLHEAGHAMYSQGLPAEHFGTPRGDDVSLGIHESQSRMWENLVGRSRAFWTYFLPKARAAFPETLKDVTEDQWYFAINDVRPSLIRTEADEATYNLHVLLRFELEQAMVTGQLSVADVPGAWNERMRKYIGLTPPDDAKGCLQDIHWSGGAIGYFPTYTLGNLYAAQFFEQAGKDLGDVDGQFARGDFAPLLSWLRKNIHSQGQKYSAPQLVERITGKALSAEPLLKHLRSKAAELYGI
jgi:carboxypeptidase Taq